MEIIKVTKQDLQDIIDVINLNPTVDEIFEVAEEWGLTDHETQDNYAIFAKMYLAYRRSMKHKGMNLIKPTSRQWKALVDVADEATAFVTENGLKLREGFKLFLDTAERMTNSMKLHEIRAKVDKIHEYFVAQKIVADDPYPEFTKVLCLEYEKQHLIRTGVEAKGLRNMVDYQYFVEASAICKEYKVRPVEFIEMLFTEFAWVGVPRTYNLSGPKAKELAKQGYTVKYGQKKVIRVSLKHITEDGNRRDKQ